MTTKREEREHATYYIIKNLNKFKTASLVAPKEKTHPDWRVCLDTEADFSLIKKIIISFPEKYLIKYDNLIEFFKKNPQLIS